MDTLLHWVFWNAILATLLGFVAAGSVLLRRPALTHALWTLVLLKLITPAFIPLPIPGYFAYRGANADDAAHSRPQSAKPASELRRTGGEGAAVTPSSEDDERTAAWRQASDFVQLGSYRASLGGADRWGRTIFQIALLGAVAWFAWTGLRIRRFYGLLSLAEPARRNWFGKSNGWPPASGCGDVRKCCSGTGSPLRWFGAWGEGPNFSCRGISRPGSTANSWPRSCCTSWPISTRRPLGPPLGTCRHGALLVASGGVVGPSRLGTGRGAGLRRLGFVGVARGGGRIRRRLAANHRFSLGHAGVAVPVDQRDWPYHAFQKETTHDR